MSPGRPVSGQQSGQQGAQRRGDTRTAVVWKALRDSVRDTEEYFGESGTVIDIGGGTGGFAVRVAELGHRVVVIDPSPDALAALHRRADESGVADLVTGQQGDLANLHELVPSGSADVVLCHGVLEIVEDPATALSAIAEVLRPGGRLSLLVSQRHAAVVARAMAGHFQQARSLLDDPAGGGPGAGSGRRFTADEVTSFLDGAGFDTSAVHAVRVFTDLVPSPLVDLEPGAAEALVELEHAVSERPEFLVLAAQVHVLATRR